MTTRPDFSYDAYLASPGETMNTKRLIAVAAFALLAACSDPASKIEAGSVSGVATYAGGTDHSGIVVQLAGYSATTNAAGSYAFAEVPTGANQGVIAVAPNSAERTLAGAVTVATGANTGPTFTFHPMDPGPNYTYTPTKDLVGKLTRFGAPAAGVTVTLDGSTTTATTDAGGTYTFADAVPGKHAVSFSGAGVFADGIPEIDFLSELGGLVPDTYFPEALYKLPPFELQGASRLLSLNLVNPARTIHQNAPPTLSPDGTLYFYGLTNDTNGGSSYSLWVGAVAGGAPIKVTDTVLNGYPSPRFSPTSKELVYYVRNLTTGRIELWAATIGAGPTRTGNNLIVDAISSYEFSPQTTRTDGASTLYAVYTQNPGGTNIVSLIERVVSTGTDVPNNEWQYVSSFTLYKKAQRILFQQNIPAVGASLPIYRHGYASCTGGTVTPRWLENSNYYYAFYYMTASIDESAIIYTIYSQTAPGTVALGMKVVRAASSSAPLLISTDTYSDYVSIDPTNTRFVYNKLYDSTSTYSQRGVAAGLLNASTPEVALLAYPNQLYRILPVFSADGSNIWMDVRDVVGGTERIYYTPSTAAATTAVQVGTDFSWAAFPRAGNAVLFARNTGSGSDLYFQTATAASATKFDSATSFGWSAFRVALDGSWFVYSKSEPVTYGDTNPNTVYHLNLTSGVKSKVIDRYYGWYISPLNETRMGIHYREELGISNNPLTTGVLDLTTGTFRPVLRRMSQALMLDAGPLGGATAPKLIMSRVNTPPPYRFQDGIYLADP
jgi:hypothetical protein